MDAITGGPIGGELLRLLQRQRDVFLRLRDLADRQRPLVDHDDPRSLLVVLAERQRLVDELGRCNAALAPFRRNWSATVERLTAEQRRQVDSLLAENDRILGAVLTSDRHDAEKLTRRQRVMAGAVSASIENGRANRAYVSRPAPVSSGLADARA